MNMKTLEDVFIHLLSDTYSAEKQLTVVWRNWPARPLTKNSAPRLMRTWKKLKGKLRV